ncbi:hypothetical protein AVEN_154246-1 [Araneus ventricosus]|uniref:Uncharacterized protein n=1 Tax=Araneus ventricosus TaxID=182803 RepID=A0A4Y2U5U4_ARAVE|nr:hypothetical protein AVEN_154246-1 [Araneus ventricosus]
MRSRKQTERRQLLMESSLAYPRGKEGYSKKTQGETKTEGEIDTRDGRDRGHRQYRQHALLPFCSLPPPPSYHHHIMQRNTPAIQPRHVEDLQPGTEPRIWNSSFGVEGPLRPVRSENLQSLCAILKCARCTEVKNLQSLLND